MELQLAEVKTGYQESDMAGDMSGKGNNVFTGGKARKGDRRCQRERREMLRFEPEKEPRRKSSSRRSNSAWDGRHDS